MAATLTVRLGAGEQALVQAEELTAAGFARFGSVAANPRPDVHPCDERRRLPPGAVPANQGSAIQYRDVGRVQSLYDQAPSRRGEPTMSVFVCAARGGDGGGDGRSQGAAPGAAELPVRFLERRPFTTQTFSPLRSSATAYLVVVAPSLPLDAAAADLARLPGAPGGGGLPDVRGLRAFVASDAQAVTYDAGTWHAPMAVLGAPGEALAFVVTQFASGVAAEDCQLVEYVADGPGLSVCVPGPARAHQGL